MACTDGGPSCSFSDHVPLATHKSELDKLQEKLDYVTSMLCAVMKHASEEYVSDMSPTTWAEELVEHHPGLPKWWSDHQKKDLKEKAIREAEHAVAQAMAQLKKLRDDA